MWLTITGINQGDNGTLFIYGYNREFSRFKTFGFLDDDLEQEEVFEVPYSEAKDSIYRIIISMIMQNYDYTKTRRENTLSLIGRPVCVPDSMNVKSAKPKRKK